MTRSRAFFLIVSLLALLLGSCTSAGDETDSQTTPLPPVVVTTETAETEPPPEVEAALEGALQHIRQGYGANAPEEGLQWRAEYTTPPGTLGSGRYRFTNGPWTVDISYPIVAPENVIYTVMIAHAQSSFRWQGTVDPAGNVIDNESPPEVLPTQAPESETETAPPEVEAALAGALRHIRQGYGANAPEEALQWRAEYTTPPETLGSSRYRFTSGPWVADVSYPIVAPENVVYTITLTNSQSGKTWTVTVTAAGAVSEQAVAPEPDGWQTYTNAVFGYTVDVPANVTIEEAPDGSSVTFTGPLVDNEWWPVLGVSHPNSPQYRPPGGVELRAWLQENLPHAANGEDVTIAGLPAVHVATPASPQAYAMDEYLLVRGGQVFNLRLLHTAGKQDWDLYNRFLNSFTFTGPAAGNAVEEATPGNQVEGIAGVIVRQPAGSQVAYMLQLESGQELALGGSEAVQAQIQTHAWAGHRVQIWGVMNDQLPGFITVERLEPAANAAGPGGPQNQPRNLSFFATPSASSELPADRLGTYHAWSAIDGNLATPWTEGVSGPGIGEGLLLVFPGPIELNRVVLDGGYDYNETVWLANNRLKRVTLAFDNGETITLDLADERGLQTFVLARAPGPNIVTGSVRLTIDSVYPGQVYDDTCLGEIEVWGWPQ